MKIHLWSWLLLLVLPLLASCLKPEEPVESLPFAPRAAEQSFDIVWEWAELYLDIERRLPDFRPAPTARALAYIHMGGYEAMIPGTDRFVSLSGVLQGFPALSPVYDPSQIDWSIALNAYYARTFRFFLFSAGQQDVFGIESLEARQLEKLSRNVPPGIVHISIEWGRRVANAVITFSETDREGATQSHAARPSDYVPPSGEGLWAPTAPEEEGRALFPYWGKVRAFAASPGDLLALPPSVSYSTDPESDYYKDHLEVAATAQNITLKDRWIAEFWSDDITGLTFSPAARIFAIANQVVKKEKFNLEETLHLYCRLGIAINDAAVGAFKSKYTYNTERPVQFIRQHIDQSFTPILGEAIHQPGITPAAPGYPSVHGAFAGVAWRIFERYFGAEYEFTDHCHFGRIEFNGAPRTYNSWKEMADEEAYSRIPLGVHTRTDSREGIRLGNVVAVKALSLRLEK